MLLIMALGERPFSLDGQNRLQLSLSPALPGWIFTDGPGKVKYMDAGGEKKFETDAGSFVFRCFNGTFFVFHNPSRENVFGPARISRLELSGYEKPVKIMGNVIPSPAAGMIRDGKFERIDIYIK
jgi:hypothetical protein